MKLAKRMPANTVLNLGVIQLHNKMNQHSLTLISSVTIIQNIKALASFLSMILAIISRNQH